MKVEYNPKLDELLGNASGEKQGEPEAEEQDQHDLELELIDAANDGDITKLKARIALGIDVNALDEDDESALWASINYGRDECFDLLVAAGADVHFKNEFGANLLHLAAERGNVGIIGKLIKLGVDVNNRGGCSKDTPLHVAAHRGYADCIALLMSNGANVNTKDVSGRTPLHDAVDFFDRNPISGASNSCAILLLDAGADVNAKDEGGQTPLDYASELDPDSGIVKLLKGRGAVEGDASGDGGEEDEGDKEDEEEGKEERLRVAAEEGDLDELKKLISEGVSVDAVDSSDSTALHYAAANGNLDCVQALLDAGANPNARDVDGATPLSDAISGRYDDCVKLLKERGAVEKEDDDPDTDETEDSEDDGDPEQDSDEVNGLEEDRPNPELDRLLSDSAQKGAENVTQLNNKKSSALDALLGVDSDPSLKQPVYQLVFDAVKEGFKVGAAGATNEAAIVAMEKALGDKYPELLKLPVVKRLLKLVLPAIALMVANVVPDQITKALGANAVGNVIRGSQLALTDATSSAVEASVEEIAPLILPMLTEFAKLGATAVNNAIEAGKSKEPQQIAPPAEEAKPAVKQIPQETEKKDSAKKEKGK